MFVTHGPPDHIRSDNGPEFVAINVRDWLGRVGVKTLYIEPGSPWEIGYCESLNSKLRDELLNGEIFTTLREAQVLIENWRAPLQCRPASAGRARPGSNLETGIVPRGRPRRRKNPRVKIDIALHISAFERGVVVPSRLGASHVFLTSAFRYQPPPGETSTPACSVKPTTSSISTLGPSTTIFLISAIAFLQPKDSCYSASNPSRSYPRSCPQAEGLRILRLRHQ